MGHNKTMIKRLQSSKNPNFFFLNYDAGDYSVKNFVVVPKHFFVSAMIEKRKPLSPEARRSGWVGCNILLSGIPASGNIFYIKDKNIRKKDDILSDWKRTLFLRDTHRIEQRGWILDVMKCIEDLRASEFKLSDLYAFEDLLGEKHPENGHIKEKIRQQLQLLRDANYLRFLGRGRYELCS